MAKRRILDLSAGVTRQQIEENQEADREQAQQLLQQAQQRLQPPPGFTGQPPLPAGTVIPASLTPGERATLQQISNWKEGDPLPPGLIDAIEASKNESEMYVPPVPPDTPPLKLPPEQDITQLTPEHRRQVEQALQSVKAEIAENARLESGMPKQAGEGVREAILAAEGHGPAITLEDDREQAAEQKVKTGRTGAFPQLERCPHCNWDLKQLDDVTVTDKDKEVFMISLLGLKSFVKEIALLGGRLKVVFRTLTPKECDACYAAVENMQKESGRVFALHEVLEYVSRYKLVLQLVAVKTNAGDLSESVQDFPESIDDWDINQNGKPLPAADKLPHIEAEVCKQVGASETIYRILGTQLNSFNRLVLKLEASVDNPDFWKVEQSQ